MKAKVFILAVLSGAMLMACNPNTSQQTVATKHSSNEKIFHTIDPDQPRVEAEISVTIQAPDSFQLQQGRIEGVNMTMGYMPVAVVPVAAGRWRATLWLGACTEPSMRWRVSLPWRDLSTNTNGFYEFEFVTENN